MPKLSLEDAHEEAQSWVKLISKGVDPRRERQEREEQERRKNTFAAIAEDFIAEKLSNERKGKEIERDIRTNFIKAWGGEPIADITKEWWLG